MPVAQMSDLLSGLEAGAYDIAIGAITITPERLARVDFSYPAHRSASPPCSRNGWAPPPPSTTTARLSANSAAGPGPCGAADGDWGCSCGGSSARILSKTGKSESESAVTSWHEGVYWAVVTMTTVGYGDKTPKSHLGRTLAVVWMVGSLILVSLLTTNWLHA
jgi:hypothetical protein